MEKVLNEILLEIKSLKKGQDELKDDVGTLKDDVSTLKDDVQNLKRVTNAISEQTATLTEFRTEINEKFDTMIENQKSLFEMYGEHEVEIRNIRRRPV